MAEAARRAGEPGVEAEAGAEAGAGGAGGWEAGGCRETGGEGLSAAALASLTHPARSVFPLAKSQRLYRSRSDPP